MDTRARRSLLAFIAIFLVLSAPSAAIAACAGPKPPQSFCGDNTCAQVICINGDNEWGCTYTSAGTACGGSTTSLCDGNGSCVANALWSCPVTPATPAGSNQQVGPPNGPPGWCFFCGQNNKYKKDGRTIYDATVPWESMDTTGYVHCGSRTDGSLYGHAQERAEIRGWVINPPGESGPNATASTGSEDEWALDILVDVGWVSQTTDPNVTPVNTIQSLASFLTPVNVIEYGIASTIPARPMLSTNTSFPDAFLSGQGAFGGVNAAVVHLEIDGWGAGRGACDSTVVSNCAVSGHTCTDCSSWTYSDHHPLNWYLDALTPNPQAIAPPTAGSTNPTPASWKGIWWPFPLYDGTTYKFPSGTYVRAVGTLWKDAAHGVGLPSDQQTANQCWNQSNTQNIGSLEMHNVDWMEPITPPAGRPHTVAGYSMCNAVANVQIHDVIPKPYPNSVAVSVTEASFGPVVNWGGMDPPYNDQTSSAARAAIGSNGVSINLSATANGSGRALFNAYYDVAWSCTATCGTRCAGQDDGCGGACAANAPGYAYCSNTGGDCRTVASCPASCVPSSVASACAGAACGTAPDGCGGSVSCGSCRAGTTCGKCNPGVCDLSSASCD